MDTKLIALLKIMESLDSPESDAINSLSANDIAAIDYVLAQVNHDPLMARYLLQRIHSADLLTQIFDTSLTEAQTISLLTDPELEPATAVKWLGLMYPGRQATIWNLLQTQNPDRYRRLKAELEKGIQISSGVVIENFNVVNIKASAELELDRLLDLVETSTGAPALTEAAERLLSQHMTLVPELIQRLAKATSMVFQTGINSEADFFRFVKWCFLVEPLLAYDTEKTLTKETLKLLHNTLMEMPNSKWVKTILNQLPARLAAGYRNWFSRQKQQNSKIKTAISQNEREEKR